MKLAVELLKRKGENYWHSKSLQKYSRECLEVARRLESRRIVNTSDELKNDLRSDLKQAIDGMEGLSDGYLGSLTHQKQLVQDLEEAIEFIEK